MPLFANIVCMVHLLFISYNIVIQADPKHGDKAKLISIYIKECFK